MSRDEKIVKILKRVLPIMSILTLFVFVMLINKKSYALFHKRIETDITIHISTADKMPSVSDKVLDKAKDKSCNPIVTDNNDTPEDPNDDTIYFSGDNECIDFNYVWYSGKLWRITNINPDGTMKIVTQDLITSITWGENTIYENSWIYQWLNEDFKDTLYNYENIIVQNTDWNATLDINNTPVKPSTNGSAAIVQGDVGLLNAYEYYQSYKNISYSKGYLNIGYYWWLLTPYNNAYLQSQSVRSVNNIGYFTRSSPSSVARGIRPSINLKSNIELSGEGTKSNPYTIVGDKTAGKTGELINTRLSGEYIRVDDKVYRIVGIENGTTKLTSFDYVRDASGKVLTKKFGSNESWETSTTSGSDFCWGYYLNNTWKTSELEQYITEGTYYLGQVGYTSYKNSICTVSNTSEPTSSCEKTTNTWTGKVGLPRVGEMFSTQLGEGGSTSSSIWLITSFYPSDALSLNNYADYNNISPSNTYGARPSINLKSNVKITSGDGMTPDTAYEISIDN